MGSIMPREINVDFSTGRYIVMDVKQYDSKSRFIKVSCYNDGMPVYLNHNDCYAFVRYRKSDSFNVFNSCVISSDGKLTFELTEQMLASTGMCCADIMIVDITKSDINTDMTIFDDNGNIINNNCPILSTMTFFIHVIPRPIDGEEIESSNEFSALNDLLIKATKDYEYIVTTTKEYMEKAKESADAAKESEKNAKESADKAEQSASDALGYANAAKDSADKAKDSADAAKDSADKANQHEQNAFTYANAAKDSADKAKDSENNAKDSENKAKKSEENAKASEIAAKKYLDDAKDYATLARSYTLGDTKIRENEETDCAKYYYEQMKLMNENIIDFKSIIDGMQNTIKDLNDKILKLEKEFKECQCGNIIDNEGNNITTDKDEAFRAVN